MEKWYETRNSDESVVISSRIRLARNLIKYPFSAKLSQTLAGDLVKNIEAQIDEDFLKIDNSSIDGNGWQSLLEKHMISPLFSINKKEKALLYKKDESASIMINEEDHLRIQSIFSGDNIDEAYETANKIDDMLEEKLEYAYDSEFGYLTSCPTNTGTGMRASFMLHLPALEANNLIPKIIPTISKFRFALRGIYGEGTESLGAVYQLSNQITLGFAEEETIDFLKTFSKSIIDDELAMEHRLLNDNNHAAEDLIYRSYGILSHARKINAKEAMSLLSNIRFGFNSKVLKYPRPQKTIYNIMMDIQPANIQKIANSTLNETEQEYIRASYIQDCLKNTE